MIGLWLGAAWAQQIAMGAGRVAMVDPGFAPVAVEVDDRRVLDVQPSPPVLLVFGLRAGNATMKVERADGSFATWTVRVDGAGTVPSGGPGLVEHREAVSFPVGGGAVCSVSASSALDRVDDAVLQVHPFGAGRWVVWGGREGSGDLVFENESQGPRVVDVAVGPAPTAGRSCLLPSETVRVESGGSIDLEVGRAPVEVWVGDPAVAHAAADGARVRVSGLRAGATLLAVRGGERDLPYLRWIEVRAAGAQGR